MLLTTRDGVRAMLLIDKIVLTLRLR